MGVRHLSREAALQVLYAMDFSNTWEIDKCDFYFENFSISKPAREYARTISQAVIVNLAEIDQKISENSKNWSLSRMSRVDRNILRLASYELIFSDTPVNIVINEALELAKDFSSEDSTRFINGILDKIADVRNFAVVKGDLVVTKNSEI